MKLIAVILKSDLNGVLPLALRLRSFSLNQRVSSARTSIFGACWQLKLQDLGWAASPGQHSPPYSTLGLVPAMRRTRSHQTQQVATVLPTPPTTWPRLFRHGMRNSHEGTKPENLHFCYFSPS